jgi:hypothetical protein
MHGNVSGSRAKDSFVITEEDYVRFLARMTQTSAIIPVRFMMQFRSASFLFLGYGLRDWNLRVMLENLRIVAKSDLLAKEASNADDHRGGDDPLDSLFGNVDSDASDRPSWAIQTDPSELERTLWTHRKIQIFDIPLDDFVTRMRASDPRRPYIPSEASRSNANDHP